MLDMVARPGLAIAGIAVLVVSYVLYRWAGARDLKDTLIGSAWQVATGGRTSTNRTDIENKFSEIAQEKSNFRRARRVAGMGIGHFVAQFVRLVAYVGILIGLALTAAGIWWK